MKAKDLINLLAEFDPETPVILSSDAEGNSYSELTDWGTGYLEPGWSGGYVEDLIDEEELEDLSSEELEEYTKILIFWPV